MKAALQALAGALGYRIERLRPPLPGRALHVLDFVLHRLNERRGGEVTFVQVGANDGVQEDPCFAWIGRYPWRGVLVEPQPDLAERLRALHAGNPRIRVEQAAIGAAAGTLTLHYLRPGAESWTSGIASLRKEALLGHRHKIADFDARLASVEVRVLPLERLLAEHGIAALDFLQIDAEGLDAEILRGLDLARLRPAVIAFEHANLAPPELAACRAQLAAHGYAFASWLGDTVACLPELALVSEDRCSFLGA